MSKTNNLLIGIILFYMLFIPIIVYGTLPSEPEPEPTHHIHHIITTTQGQNSPEPIETESVATPHSPLYVVTSEEIEMLAKVVYREAGGIPNKAHQAAVIWCILNRVDNGTWGDTIEEVVTYPNAFAWVPDTPTLEEFKSLATDVISRWNWEKQGVENVGRALPNSYLYFIGDGEYNYFTETYDDSIYWDWSLPNPYQ